MALCCLCCFLPFCLLGDRRWHGRDPEQQRNDRIDTQTLTVDPDTPVTLNVEGTSGSITVRRGGRTTK